MMSKRPNILFAIADDASHMSAYGHSFLSTPNFDRIAKEGALFLNAFTVNPKCAPSRACTLTGRQTWQLEEGCNHFGLFPGKFPVYTDVLENAGYHVGFTGKGWCPGDWKRGGRSRNPAGPEYNTRTLTPPGRTKINACDYAANFDDFLAARPSGEPFCFWYGGWEPHRPYEIDEGLRSGLEIASVKLPAYWPQDDAVRRDVLDYANEVQWFDAQLGKMLARLEEMGELDNTLVVVTSDNGMPFPRVKGQMYDDDFRLPMAVRPPKGWMAEPGRRVADLVCNLDFAPTFLDAAGVLGGSGAPSISGVPGSAGTGSTGPDAPLPGMLGRSLLPLLRSCADGYNDPSRNRVFLGRERHDLGRENDFGYPVRCIRTPEYLYVWNMACDRWPAGNPETGFTNCDSSPTKNLILDLNGRGEGKYFDLAFGKRPEEELYAVSSDHECLHNLALDPAYGAVKESLRTELEAHLRDTEDPRMFGKGDIFETYEYVGAGEHSWKALQEGRWKKQKF